MRWLTIGLLALFTLYGGYWFIGATALDRGVTGWLDALPAEGTPASYSDVQVWGFPNRFDLTISDPVLGDPALLEWRAAFFQLFALSYAPHNLIAVWPDSQQITTPAGTLTLRNAKARASIRFLPSTALPLDHLELVVDQGRLTGATVLATFDQLRFATRQRPDRLNAHEVGLEVIGLTPAIAITGLPAAIDQVHLDLTLVLSAPLDRYAAESGLHLDDLTLSSLRFQWGPMALEADGTLYRDDQGAAAGQISVRLRDWRHLLAVAQSTGALDLPTANLLTNALTTLERMDTDPAELDVPLKFANGRVSLAGLPIGASPQF